MSILNVNQLQPVGGGNTITVGSSNIDYSGSITGNISVDGNLTVTGVVSNEDVTNIDSVGIITARSDVSIADKIVHTGDTNTAIRFPAADTFTVETGGSERVRIDSAGNFGINKNAPTSVLDVRQTNTGAATEIKLFNLDQSNATTQTAALVMTPDVRANGVKIVAVKEVADMSSSANKDLALTFQTVVNNTAVERLRITSDGKFGLGTQTPGDKLSISGGSLGIYNTGNSHGNVYFYKDGTPKGWLKYRGDNDTLLIGNVTDSIHVLSSGNVAIGHNSAPTKLGIRGTSASTDATVQIVGNGISTLLLGQDAGGGVIRGQGGSNQIKFKVGGNGDEAATTGGIEAARFNQSGNLVFPSGQGIDFSATTNSSGSMVSELLDDYEEGTFTPVWGSGSAAYSSPAPTYSTAAGHYTKIGNVVYYDIHLVTTAWNSAGTTMWIYGLPFTTRSSLYQQGGGSTFCIEGVDSQDAINNLTTQIAPNKTNIELYYQTPATGANYNTFGTNNVSEGNQVNIRVSGFYYTNS